MSATSPGQVGSRIAYQRSARATMTQQQLAVRAGVALGTIRKIERGERGVTDSTLDAVACALGVDPSRLVAAREHVSTFMRCVLPALSAVIATYDMPDDGPVRPLPDLRPICALRSHRPRRGA
ncbi:helix-turn-helix domain-containing protein [Streptomyces sp. 372A]